MATGGNTGDNIGSFQDDGTAVNNLSASTNTTGAHTHTLTKYPNSSGYGADVSGGGGVDVTTKLIDEDDIEDELRPEDSIDEADLNDLEHHILKPLVLACLSAVELRTSWSAALLFYYNAQ